MFLQLQVVTRIARAHWGARSQHVYDKVGYTLTARPWHCDHNGHVNNLVYLGLAELGRAEWAGRNGLAPAITRHRLRMIIASMGVTYRQEIRLSETFRIETTLAGHDDKWLFFAQEFVLLRPSGEVPAARVHVRVRVRSATDGWLSVAALETLCGLTLEPNRHWSEELSSWVSAGKVSARILTRKPNDPPVVADA
jgi:acyl-CoA thioesterase FadM